jgi:hypothetical protein
MARSRGLPTAVQARGRAAPIFCDLYDKTANTIFEANGSVARPAFRMAVGQLADYSRLIDPAPKKAILVPPMPRNDLLNLASSEGVSVVWPDGRGFAAVEP